MPLSYLLSAYARVHGVLSLPLQDERSSRQQRRQDVCRVCEILPSQLDDAIPGLEVADRLKQGRLSAWCNRVSKRLAGLASLVETACRVRENSSRRRSAGCRARHRRQGMVSTRKAPPRRRSAGRRARKWLQGMVSTRRAHARTQLCPGR